jgi:prephenate dehydrogenase
MKTVAIVGVGLIGGSFGLALRQNGFRGRLIGVSSAPAIEAGIAAGAIDAGAGLEEAARAADLIYLAQPVDRILTTLGSLQGLVRPTALVTDAGSTKAAIVRQAAKYLPSGSFLGGHPLAGKEQRGAQAAEPGLFAGRPYVLTPEGPATEASREFRSWLTRIGARLVEIPADEHDRIVALTSHLPQVISTALAVTLSRQPDRVNEIFGPGLLDMTRLAMSAPDLWIPILKTNKGPVTAALEAYISTLDSLRHALQNDNLVKLFETGFCWAKLLREPKAGI